MGRTTHAGAQTERRGVSGPVRAVLVGYDLTGLSFSLVFGPQRRDQGTMIRGREKTH